MPGLLFQIDDPFKHPGAGEIPAVLFKVNGPGKVADNGGPGQTMAGLSANAQQPACAFYRDHLVVCHYEIHIAGGNKIDVVGDLMPTQFIGEGGIVGVRTRLLKK